MDLNLNNSQKSEREFYLEDDFDFEDVESFNLRAKYIRPQENKENFHFKYIFCENNINRENELVKVKSFKVNCINSGLNTLANCGTLTEKEEFKSEINSKFSLKAYLTRTINLMLTKDEIKKVKGLIDNFTLF